MYFTLSSVKCTFKTSVTVLYFPKDSCIHRGHHKLARTVIDTQGKTQIIRSLYFNSTNIFVSLDSANIKMI